MKKQNKFTTWCPELHAFVQVLKKYTKKSLVITREGKKCKVMNSGLIIIFLLMLATPIRAQKFSQGFGVAYLPYNKIQISSPVEGVQLQFDKGNYEVTYKLQFDFKSFYIVSLTNVYMNKGKGCEFAPTFSEFDIFAGYKFGKFKLEISHRCIHTVMSKSILPATHSGGFDKISLSYNL